MKNTVKKLALLFGVIAASTLSATAEPGDGEGKGGPGKGGPGGKGGPDRGRRMNPEARMTFMTEKLGLTDEQQEQIKAVYEKNATKFKDLRAKGRDNLTDEDKTAMGDLFKSQQAEIAKILTDEQQEKLKAMRPQGRGRGDAPGKGRGNRGKGGPGEKGDDKGGEREGKGGPGGAK